MMKPTQTTKRNRKYTFKLHTTKISAAIDLLNGRSDSWVVLIEKFEWQVQLRTSAKFDQSFCFVRGRIMTLDAI